MLIIIVIYNFLALEFLYQKVGVIHGDISMNNIMINRVWNYGPNDTPSLLRIIACAKARKATCANIGPQSVVQVSATSTTVVRAPTAFTPSIIQTSTTSAAQVLATSGPPQVISATATSLTVVQAPCPVPATAVAVVQVAATSAIQQLAPTFQVSTASAHVDSAPATYDPATCALIDKSRASSVGAVVDYAGTTEHIEFAGMIIDCDFMRYEGQEINLTSVRNFSIDMFNYAHR